MKRDKIDHMLSQSLPAIWRFGLSLTGDVTLTDDLVQSTCLRALEKQDQFLGTGSFTGWCLQICRSIWLNDLRKRDKERAFATLDDDDIAAVSSTADTDVYAREIIAKIMHLPQAQRVTVNLVFVEQFTYSEAATVLDVPIGTIMSRLHAARKTLQSFADEYPSAKGSIPK